MKLFHKIEFFKWWLPLVKTSPHWNTATHPSNDWHYATASMVSSQNCSDVHHYISLNQFNKQCTNENNTSNKNLLTHIWPRAKYEWFAHLLGGETERKSTRRPPLGWVGCTHTVLLYLYYTYTTLILHLYYTYTILVLHLYLYYTQLRWYTA